MNGSVALDHLGCGLSDKPQDWPYRLLGHIDNVRGLVQELDLRGLTLGLHDWGGAIGMGLAAREPERVARFVIFNTAAFRSRRIPLRIAICRLPGLGALAVRGLNGFLRASMSMATEKGLSPAVGVLVSLAPPTTPTELGKARPVGLPVAAEKLASPPHWMPTSRKYRLVASTMRASMST